MNFEQLALVGLVLLLAVAIYLNNKQHAEWAKISATANQALTDLLAKLHGPALPVAPPNVTHTVTQTFGGGATGQPGVVTSPDTVNGVPSSNVGDDTAKAIAREGVAVSISDPNMYPALLAGSQAWWTRGMSAEFRNEYLKQTDASTPFGQTADGAKLHAHFVALDTP